MTEPTEFEVCWEDKADFQIDLSCLVRPLRWLSFWLFVNASAIVAHLVLR